MAVQESSKARQVYLVLRDRIAGGHYADKAALPVEQDLASEHGVSRATVRRALDALETEGLITRRQGAGTFVRNDGRDRPMAADFADALAHLTEMGRSTSVRLLSFGYETANTAIAGRSSISVYSMRTNFSEEVARFRSSRSAHARPLSITACSSLGL